MRSRRQRVRLRPCARRASIVVALRPEPGSLSDQRQFVPWSAILTTIYELFVIPVTDVDRAKRFYGGLGGDFTSSTRPETFRPGDERHPLTPS
jgi:hypothetical protein